MGEPGVYTIVPEQVAVVLGDFTRTANRLIEEYHALEEPLDAASIGSGSSDLVSSALSEVVAWVQRTLSAARDEADSCLDGAALATNTYIFGDVEMARAYQEGR